MKEEEDAGHGITLLTCPRPRVFSSFIPHPSSLVHRFPCLNIERKKLELSFPGV
jgi:hypothetical protein